jgi:hypothetical protein
MTRRPRLITASTFAVVATPGGREGAMRRGGPTPMTLYARAGSIEKEGSGAWAPTRMPALASFLSRTPAEFVGR